MTFPAINWTNVKELAEVVGHRLPHLEKVLRLRTITAHDAYIGWMAAGMTTLLVLVAIGCYAGRRWKIGRCLLAGRNEVPDAIPSISDDDDRTAADEPGRTNVVIYP